MSSLERRRGARGGEGPGGVSPVRARLLLVLAVVCGAVGGVLVIDPVASAAAVAAAGPELTRLMRAMAGMKLLMAAGAFAGVYWRLGRPVGPALLLAYALAVGVMAAGPGMIWAMVDVGTGALLLHGGLAATAVLLWRDPGVAAGLAAVLERRRSGLAG